MNWKEKEKTNVCTIVHWCGWFLCIKCIDVKTGNSEQWSRTAETANQKSTGDWTSGKKNMLTACGQTSRKTQLNSTLITTHNWRIGGGFCPQYILTYIWLIHTLLFIRVAENNSSTLWTRINEKILPLFSICWRFSGNDC